MIYYLLLAGVIAFGVLETMLQKSYNIRTGNRGVFLFGALSAYAAAITFLCSASFPLHYSLAALPYSIVLALSYGSAIVGTVMAYRYGPLAITALIASYSLLVPTFYGIIFLHETPRFTFFIGLTLLVISLFLINYRKEKNAAPFSPKWLIFMIITFCGNGLCSTVQTMFVRNVDGRDGAPSMKNEFMIVSLVIIGTILILASFAAERHDIGKVVGKGGLFAVGYGVLNGFLNLFVILIQVGKVIPVAVMYPCISAFGMVATYLLSVFFYKEKMTAASRVGFYIGIAACVLLNL